MKVFVSEETIQLVSGTENARKLHQLFNFACEGRHVIIFEQQSSVNVWLDEIDQGSRDAYIRAIELSYRKASTLSHDTATVIIHPVAERSLGDPLSILNIDDAVRVLGEPLGILVENSENDWHFLCGIMPEHARQTMLRAVTDGWVTPLHGGGANIIQQLETRLMDPFKGIRTFVLFDSDRRHPDELDPSWAPINQEACQGYLVEQFVKPNLHNKFWMLKRRFIESYIPRARIERVAAENPNIPSGAVDAFFRLSLHGRWFFNMKKGLSGDAPLENAHRSKNLYSGISTADRSALNSGFSRNLADQYSFALSEPFNWDNEAFQEASEKLPLLMRLL